MAYKPNAFTVPMYLYIPSLSTVKGVSVKTYPSDGILIYGSFKTYGGTEIEQNGLYSVLDTANVETWYRPDITEGCRIRLAEAPAKAYEIIAPPENIDMRNQYLKIRVQALAGGA